MEKRDFSKICFGFFFPIVKTTETNYQNYGILQLLLVAAHYTASIMIIYAPDADTFAVPWKFQWNSWSPFNETAGDTSACAKGCLIGEETYIFAGDERLNVTRIVAAFGLVSGTNHFLQFLLYRFQKNNFGGLFRTNKIAIIRNVDFAFSAPLMLICCSILFYSPPDAQFLLLVFGFQFLVQLAGASCELIKQIEPDSGKKSMSLYIFYSAFGVYVLPWAYQIALLYYGGALSDKFPTFKTGTSGVINYPRSLSLIQEAIGKIQPLLVPPVNQSGLVALLGNVTNGLSDPLKPSPAPLQVYFFLSWLFLSFGLFPLALFFKLHESPGNTEKVNYQYEIIYSVLSFLSKLPLQFFFFLGSFQREKFAPVGDPNFKPPTDGDFTDGVIMNAVIPASVCTVLGLLTLWVFRGDLAFTSPIEKSGIVGFVAVLFSFTVFIPMLITLGESQGTNLLNPLTGLNLISVSSVCAVLVAGAVEHFLY